MASLNKFKDTRETWTDINGNVMFVDDMEDSHVRNAFKLLLRRIRKHNDHVLFDDLIYEMETDWCERD